MDVEQINNLLGSSEKQEVQFSDAQWLYVQDTQQGSYNNYIQYITTTLKQQFIDYHNAYLWIPFAAEILNTSASGPLAVRPPTIALRHSVLSLIGQLVVTTDQGQTIVNDNNTQMINNLRLEVENDSGWVFSEGTDLNFALDGTSPVPAQSLSFANPSGGSQTSYAKVNGPSFGAFQGIEAGAVGGFPLTNDPNEFGNNTGGSFTFNSTAYALTAGVPTTNSDVTALNGVSFSAAETAGYFQVTFSDGRVGNFTYTTFSSGVVQTLGGIYIQGATSGSMAIGAPLGLAAGAYWTTQATGWTDVLNVATAAEEATISLTFQVAVVSSASATGSSALVAIGGISLAATGSFAGSASGQISGRNPNFNRGFLDRVTVFQNSSAYVYTPSGTLSPAGKLTNAYGAHTYYYEAIVPLKLLHDLFMQMNFPIINVGFNITVYMNQSSGAAGTATYPPFQTSANTIGTTALISGGADNTPNPALYYGQQLSGGSGTRLYYRSVKFSPADNAVVAQRLTAGFTKAVKFISTDWTPMVPTVAAGSSPVQYQIATSVVHPLRLWVLPYQVPTVNGSATNVLTTSVYAPGVITGFFNQVNVQVNNVNYFRNSFQLTEDQSDTIHNSNPDEGSMIRFQDWLQYKRYLCLDLTRVSDRIQSPTEPVSLIFLGTRSDGLNTPVQIYFLIERLNQVTFRFSSSDVAIVVGNLD